MAQEGKKISFGFSKSIKKPDLKSVSQIESKKVDYIEYVDEKSIKVIGKEEKEDGPLVIPMLGSKSWHDRIINKINADIYGASSGVAQKNGNAKQIDVNKKLSNGDEIKDPINTSKSIEKVQKQTDDSTVSLEVLAAQEIIQDLQEEEKTEETTVDISIEQSNNLIGEKESTLENYEEIPIDKFGVALLRGMGWEPEKGIGKNSKVVPVTVPNLRPRGMGLGADKVMLQKQNIQSKTKEEKELKLEKGCYIRIMAGKYNNNFGQLEGFDDESGRLIVKLALGNKCVSLNGYLIEPVTKDNYMKNSKVLNISTYEKFNNKLGSKRTLNISDSDEAPRKEEENIQNKRSSSKKVSKYRDKSYTSDESSNSDKNHKRKYEINGKDSYHKSKKLKKHRHHDNSELSRKNSKKDKDREKPKDRLKSRHSSNKSSDKKKHKKHKRSRSKSSDRR